jgi:uncharacterized protein (TIGR02246 family)
MRTLLAWLLVLTAFAVTVPPRLALAQPAKDNPQEAMILKAAEAIVDAFNKGDAKAMAACWTTDGDYVTQSGKLLQGRAAIEEAFRAYFAENKGMKLRINVDSIRFPTPDTAIKDGTVEVIPPDGAPPSIARFSNFQVNKGGQWSLISVREAPFVPPSNFDQLRVLDWMIGNWASDAAKGEVSRVSFAWSPGQNFIESAHTVAFKDIYLSTGTQRIAWDGVAKRIRSWSFEADGGFSEGTWSKEGDKWVCKSNSVLQDGKKLSATNIVTKVDANTITWQSKDRLLDGKPLADSGEIQLKRVK